MEDEGIGICQFGKKRIPAKNSNSELQQHPKLWQFWKNICCCIGTYVVAGVVVSRHGADKCEKRISARYHTTYPAQTIIILWAYQTPKVWQHHLRRMRPLI